MKSRVLIVGGGVAALEATLALNDLCGELVSVEVISPSPQFVHRPYAVGEPYGLAEAVRYDLGDLLGRVGAEFRRASVTAIDARNSTVVTYRGDEFAYDRLIVAPGVNQLWPVPGAVTYRGLADELGLRDVLNQLYVGALGSLAFTMPDRDGWALPLYELALLTRHELGEAGLNDAELSIVSPEHSPLEVFGEAASSMVAALLHERGIEFLGGRRPLRFEKGRLRLEPNQSVRAEMAVSLPRLEGRRIRGLPHDLKGFIEIDDHCRVPSRERVFAAGDVTDFPIKQGGVATQQADVIAEAIAAELGIAIEPRPFEAVLRAELLTGEQPLYLFRSGLDDSGAISSLTANPPWERRLGKIVGRYLPEFLAHSAGATLTGR